MTATPADLARLGVRVKELEWGEEFQFCGQPCFSADTPFGTWMVTSYSGRGGRWAITGPDGTDSDDDWSTSDLAKAAAHGDHIACVLATLGITSPPKPYGKDAHVELRKALENLPAYCGDGDPCGAFDQKVFIKRDAVLSALEIVT